MEQKQTTVETWDAIVIGSGIGGLTAAGLLAKMRDMKVLVLEKHSERGGLTHTFRRDGASWDVGVHYMGNMQPGAPIRSLFDYLSDHDLEWNKMPDDFERFAYPGLDFAEPSDKQQYLDRLIKRFPDEEAAIRRYFVDIQQVSNWYFRGQIQVLLPWPLSFLIAQWRRLSSHNSMLTTGEYLNSHFKSPELKAVLATQWGDYGLPPSESSFVLHAMVIQSYFKGAWFPRNGASRISRTFEVGIEAKGGAIKVCHNVTSILTEGTRVVGVKAMDSRRAVPTEVVFNAPIVISDAGATITYKHLLPPDGVIGQRTAKQREFAKRLERGLSAVCLYIRLGEPVSKLGVKGENYWISTSLDHDNIDAHSDAVVTGRPRYTFLSFPSAKSGDDRYHTAEALAFVSAEAFSNWGATDHSTRGKEYLELKNRISEGLLDLIEGTLPGFKALVRYCELSTPLTVENFTSHPRGAFYGLAGTPERYNSTLLLEKSPIEGLYLSGNDASSLGVAGAMMGGVMAVSRILGPFGFYRIFMAAARAKPGKKGLSVPTKRSPDKKQAVLVGKNALTSVIWQLEFELDELPTCAPGQFAMLRVAPFEWRSYSIAKVDKRRVTFLISTRTKGDGSIFTGDIKVGDETQIELPFGEFQLVRNSHRRVFIATGTGLSPFLPMFRTLEASGELSSAELLFGCYHKADDFTHHVSPLPKTTVCVDGDAVAEGAFLGRVTDVLNTLEFDPTKTDFYLCGVPAMLDDCRAILAHAGATRIFTEKF